MGQAPSQPGPPGTKFRVIGAGMCRTGTKTLNQALTILLDGPVHDAGIQSLGGSWQEVTRWIEIMKLAPQARTFGERKYVEYLLASILDGYVATVDAPAIVLTPELMQVFPNAIVIATTRDQETWWKSMNYLHTLMSTWYIPYVVLFIPKLGMYRQWREAFKKLAKWRYGEQRINEGTLKKHEDHLRAVVPKDKLFWFNVQDGWEPLCQILNLPVPDVPFPHNNSREDAGRSHRDAVFFGLICWIAVLMMTAFALWTCWRVVPYGIGRLAVMAAH